ncbi:MAG: hypothetical protein SFW36_11775 [Leptolyngbyaceae cyanobacterium bins.59]|nr:hypothetical protein [Leptolyngbyaceae cyanobacterium bins.59]
MGQQADGQTGEILMADELRSVLELANDEELQALTEILFRRKFNPLDYFYTPDPIDVQSQDRQGWLDLLEERFRFLAADGMTVLRRKTEQISYRQILIQICRYLKIRYSDSFSTTDLEAEIFLNLLNRAWKKLPQQERSALTGRVQDSLIQADLVKQLPLPLQKDPVGLLLKGGSAIAVSAVLRPILLQQIAHQFAIHFATYQVAKEATVRGGVAAATQFQNYLALQTAKRGMAISAARYGATRSLLTFLGPALWTWFFVDLGWRAISINYSRVIPTVFTLAQIRLTRTECFEPV